MYPQYIYILPYVELICVMLFHTSIVNWCGAVVVSSVHVHSVMCLTYLV